MTRSIATALLLCCLSYSNAFVITAKPSFLSCGRVAFSNKLNGSTHLSSSASSGSTSLCMSYKSNNNRFDVTATTTLTTSEDNSMSTTALKTALVDDSLEGSSSMVPRASEKRGVEAYLDSVLEGSFWAPRLFLAAIACLYGTNFALGSIMNDALPASAATCDRMVLAALALSPFIVQLKAELRGITLLAGVCTAMGYVTQSLALVDTTPATVSFLGAAIVVVCPALQALVDKKPMGWKDAPQTWIAAMLCIAGVGVLELWNPNGSSATAAMDMGMSMGHGLALCQAVGFGGGIYLSSKAMTQHPDQALPVTSVMVAMTALVSMLWSVADGWMFQPNWQSMALPQVLFSDPSATGGSIMLGLSTVGAAVLWTGLISTSLNFFLENFALGHVSSAEASVILATEPLWAALFASVLVGEGLGWNDSIGGLLIVMACLANTAAPEQVHKVVSGVLGNNNKSDNDVNKLLP